MKLSKKVVLVCLFAILAMGMIFARGKKDDSGKVLNIMCWNTEFQDRFNAHAADLAEKAGVEVNWIIVPNQGNAYQNALDEALLNQANVDKDERIDMFLVEADYSLKYANSEYTMDVYKEMGLKKSDTANMYQYTKDIVTDANGMLKGLSWQATPAGVIYRRSMAKEILGTDDPAKIQEALSTWEKFDAVAEKVGAKGYAMVAGYDDDYRVFSDNITKAWVSKDNKIQIDDQLWKWVEQTKKYTDKGWNNKAALWSSAQWAGGNKDPQKGFKKVFCYFGPAWFINFSLKDSVDSDGDWAFCKGPQGFSWGGSWVCACAGSDNTTLVKDIMYRLTCDKQTALDMVEQDGEFANHEIAMKEVAASSYKNEFLGGQNNIAYFLDSAKSIDKTGKLTGYDQGCNEEFQAAFHEYFDGNLTKEEALEAFYTAILEKYPDLKR